MTAATSSRSPTNRSPATTGYARGFPATRPSRGRKLNPNSAAVTNWQRHLVGQARRALAKVGASKIYDYTVANNGVAADLTGGTGDRALQNSRRRRAEQDRLRSPTPPLPDLPRARRAAAGSGRSSAAGTNAGAGVVVGVLDTGIWPESTAFAGGTGIPVPATWHGKCVAGEQFTRTSHCNDKLIGARYYVEPASASRTSRKADYLSPRDGDGHGSHTASTAAGNAAHRRHHRRQQPRQRHLRNGARRQGRGVQGLLDRQAGRRRGCFNSDSVAAINDAVLDGVDVINYSIGGGSESDVSSIRSSRRSAVPRTPDVFVANSAGNSGPGASTFDHPSPWVTTVAAATFRRAFQAVELGNGARYVGASTTAASVDRRLALVTSVSVKLASARLRPTQRSAAAGTLDPAKARRQGRRSATAASSTGSRSASRSSGPVVWPWCMTNTSPNSINGDYHPIPSVHVDHVDARQPIIDYIAGAGAAATAKIVPLTPAELAAAPQVPEIAAFSSRGPSTTTEGDILKPDIAAPGVDVRGRGCTAVPLRSELRLHLRYVDGVAAHRRHRRTDEGQAPDLAAVGDQVGDDDQRR